MDDRGGFVGRGGRKLDHALQAFGIDVRGRVCADFGCNVGGFTDCLLQRGAARVYALDTGYGALAWKLRNDPRVVSMERRNALHEPMPESAGAGVALVAMDLSWTPQRLGVPAAGRWLAPGGTVVSLIKPHYEAKGEEKEAMTRGVMEEGAATSIVQRVVLEVESLGWRARGLERSPIEGGRGKGRRGNAEWVAWLEPVGRV